MTARVLPTESGWWWAQWGENQRAPVLVWRGSSSGLLWSYENSCDQTLQVTDARWTWLEPVAPPGTVARLEAERDEAPLLRAALMYGEHLRLLVNSDMCRDLPPFEVRVRELASGVDDGHWLEPEARR